MKRDEEINREKERPADYEEEEEQRGAEERVGAFTSLHHTNLGTYQGNKWRTKMFRWAIFNIR